MRDAVDAGPADLKEEKVAFLARKWSIPRDEARRLLDGETDG